MYLPTFFFLLSSISVSSSNLNCSETACCLAAFWLGSILVREPSAIGYLLSGPPTFMLSPPWHRPNRKHWLGSSVIFGVTTATVTVIIACIAGATMAAVALTLTAATVEMLDKVVSWSVKGLEAQELLMVHDRMLLGCNSHSLLDTLRLRVGQISKLFSPTP